MHYQLTADSGHLPLVNESVDTVITDPPWHFARRISKKAKAVAAASYDLLPDDQLTAHFLELDRVLKPGGHLYVFVPDQKLELALCIGLIFHRFAGAVWVKATKDGEELRIGLGHTFRMCHEHVLAFSKGTRRPVQHHRMPSVVGFARSRGSVKPERLYADLARFSTPQRGVILDPWAGSDPLGRAGLEDYTTISSDLIWKDWQL